MCVDACLDEDDIKMMVNCIRLDRDCARVCHTTASYGFASHSQYSQTYVNLCTEICKACGDASAKHEMDHCQDCAQACRECEEAYRNFSGLGA